jgi:hypothetical protein
MNGSLGMSISKFSKIITNFEKGPKCFQEIADLNTFSYYTVHRGSLKYPNNQPSEMKGGGWQRNSESCGKKESKVK